MTLIAWIFCCRDRPVPASACASLKRPISRNPSDEISAFKDHRSYFARVDIGV